MADEHGVHISNREVYDLLIVVRDEVRSNSAFIEGIIEENIDIKKRTRALELKFYGVLAGLVGAVTVMLAAPVSQAVQGGAG